ncbi:CP family cyanate transporter-like MFS transporter [Streptomyces puniciscabiei]|uniref:CP family cyanate transporter-like MFS transporter n=1 Tax=Streptomyces puniciscabiei TaxID=164348 RepID=A0A542U9Z5_9ACTN|nr:MFS transporter [Streptomyces puniciscabiei]TQK95886.1 CP family cyanate transporter-like MFS transporter [Streptomyces puniciscabiei]
MNLSSVVDRAAQLWALAGLMLLALNLRAAITGISPMLSDLQATFHLSGVALSFLTTLPVLCLGAFASLAAPIAHRVGTETTIAGALALLTAGILLRTFPSAVLLFSGTVLAGAGIALGNVLLPVVIKRRFAHRVGPLTGLSMMLMAGSGAVAAGLAVPLHDAAGWRIALAVWAIPSLVAALVWGPLAVRGRRAQRHISDSPVTTGESLLGSSLAWAVAGFLGLVSLMFYALMAWLPEIMHADGFDPTEAGMMVSAIQMISVPLGLVIPVLAARLPTQRPLITGISATKAVALAGVLLAPQAGWLWIVFLGLATGSAFPLAFTLLSLRSPSASVAAQLSGMAQTTGYLVAGLGPLLTGLMHSFTGGWAPPLLLLLVLLVPETMCGLLAGRPSFVRAGD